MNEQVVASFETALRSRRPVLSLREVVRRRLDEDSVPHEQVRQELTEFRAQLQEEDREQDEDVVLDVLDFVTGFSSSRMSLAEGVPHLPMPVKERAQPSTSLTLPSNRRQLPESRHRRSALAILAEAWRAILGGLHAGSGRR